ncbi:MAG: T9SS type A sorting domain-containing protein [Bacteroidota bacterium]
MKPILLFLCSAFLASLTYAQSFGLKQLGALGGDETSPTGIHLQHALGAVAATSLQQGDDRLDQGMFLPCDWPCANVIKSRAVYLNSSISLSPNPTHDAFQLTGEAQHLHRYELYGPNGQQIAEGKIRAGQVSLTSLPVGMYLLRIYGRQGDLAYVGKVIKE